MRSLPLLAIIGALGVAGYFTYNYYNAEENAPTIAIEASYSTIDEKKEAIDTTLAQADQLLAVAEEHLNAVSAEETATRNATEGKADYSIGDLHRKNAESIKDEKDNAKEDEDSEDDDEEDDEDSDDSEEDLDDEVEEAEVVDGKCSANGCGTKKKAKKKCDEKKEGKLKEPEMSTWGLEGWSLKIRAGAFFPFSDTFRRAYKNVGPTIQLEASVKFPRDCFHAWANVDSFFQRGTRYHCQGCRVGNIVNLSCGLKMAYRVCGPLELYAGLGPSLGWLDIWVDRSISCEHNVVRKWALGVVAKSGFYYYVTTNVFLEFWLDYLYQPTKLRNISIDVGGIKSGLGIGVAY